VTFAACLDWVDADFLARLGLPHDDPPCLHSPDHCPPLDPDREETAR
jgi:hypothetical protein